MKKTLFIAFIIMAIISMSFVYKSYGLLESEASGTVRNDLGKWIIKINDVLVSGSNTTTLNIDNFAYEDSTTVANNVIAPGRNGYFDLVLDPYGTDVEIEYTISFLDTEIYADNISYNVVMLSGGSVNQVDDTTFNGVIDLDSIDDGEVITFRVFVNWEDDEEYDLDDTLLGIDEESKISIPIAIELKQYLG